MYNNSVIYFLCIQLLKTMSTANLNKFPDFLTIADICIPGSQTETVLILYLSMTYVTLEEGLLRSRSRASRGNRVTSHMVDRPKRTTEIAELASTLTESNSV